MLLPNIRLRLLGVPEVTRGDLVISLSPKLIALLALLGDRAVFERSHVAEILWPGSCRRLALHSLSQAIYALRRRVSQDVVLTDVEHLQLGSASSDVVEFSVAMESGNYLEAFSLYGGRFLTHFELPTATSFSRWLDARRRDLALSAVPLLEADVPPAVRSRLAQLIIPDIPYDCRPRQALLQAMREMGKNEEADVLLGEFQLLWQNELGVIFAEAWRGSVRPEALAAKIPFVGREPEIGAVMQMWRHASRGSAGGIVVEGEAGIGKSRLLDRAVRKIALRGGRVLTARAFAAEQRVPFGVVGQWLKDLQGRTLIAQEEPWFSILSHYFPFLTDEYEAPEWSSDGAGPLQLLTALQQCFLNVAHGHGLVLVIDDLHWMDSASLAFVSSFFREARGKPVMLLAASRPSREKLPAHISPSFVTLGPLNEGDVAILLRHFTGEDDVANRAEMVWKLTAGSPLLVTLVLAHGESGGGQLHPSVRAHFDPVLESISRQAKLLIAAVALLPQTLSASDVAILSDLGEQEVMSALEEATSLGLIRISADGLELMHGLIGEMVLDVLPTSSKAALYGRTARWLELQGTSAKAVVAVQYDLAGSKDDAYHAALGAAAASRQLFAYREAEYFLRLAIDNAPSLAYEAIARVEMADVLSAQGRGIEAREILNAAPYGAEQRALCRLNAQRILVELLHFDRPTVVEEAYEFVEKSANLVDVALLARLYCVIAATAHDLGKADRAISAATAAAELVPSMTSEKERIRIQVRSAIIQALYADLERGLEIVEGCLAAAKRWPPLYVSCLASRASLRVAAGRPMEAETDFVNALEIIERFALVDHLGNVLNNLGVCYMEQARFDEAREQFQRALRVGVGFAERGATEDNLAILDYESGDWPGAISRCDHRIDSARKIGSVRSFCCNLSVKGLAALELGYLSLAMTCEREVLVAERSQHYWSNDISYLEIFLARMACLRGDHGQAADRLSEAIRAYAHRDFYCRSRMQVELLRACGSDCPTYEHGSIQSFRIALAQARAVKLVDQVDGLLVALPNRLFTGELRREH